MAERELPSNSNASRLKDMDKEKVLEAIDQGAKRRRSKLSSSLIAQDVHEVGSNVMADVFIPAVKDIIFNVIQTSVELLLFGESRGSYRSSRSRNNERTGYSRMYRREADEYERPLRRRSASLMTEDVVIDRISSRAKAEDIKDKILGIQDEYDMVQLAEVYQLCGVDWDYTDRNWGWTDLRERDVDIYPRAGSWTINLPRPIALK